MTSQQVKASENPKSNVPNSTKQIAADASSAPKGEVRECNKPLPEGSVYSSMGKFDCHAFFVHCSVHNKVLVTRRYARWMPFVEMPANRSWKDGALIGFCQVLAAGDQAKFRELMNKPPHLTFKFLHLMRLQTPQTLKFIKRAIFYFRLNPEASNFKCCQPIESAPHLEWFPLAQVRIGRVPHLWGPELVECCKYIADGIKQKITEYSLEEAYMFVPRDPPRNLEEDMLKSLRISKTDVERLYDDYIEHCFPSFYLTLESFCAYMSKYKFERDETRLAKLFAAFNIARNGCLSFHELLLGLICLEPAARHGEFRVRFIFRYYDTNQSGHLDEEKLKAMLADMHKPEKVEEKLNEAINAFGATSHLGRLVVNEKDFSSAIGKHQFRGTSVLCRLQKSIFMEISRSLAMKHLRRIECKKILTNALLKRGHQGVCPTCKERRYKLAIHQVTVDINGNQAARKLKQVGSKSVGRKTAIPTAQRFSLEYVYKPYSAANVLIKLLRIFVQNKGTVQRPFGLMNRRPTDFWKLLLQLHKELTVLLEAEFKCQKVYSPCYVIGDIHGNIEDLMSLEKSLWPLMPIVGASCVFLGDYVDRGQWGLECALYIIAFKLLCPNKVTMLRGNHEVRSLQKHYSYQQECIRKYGEEFGIKIFELTNLMFDQLPVCAVIDDAIYCAHGGIPHAVKTIDEIAQVQRKIREPEPESTIAWEILWSDPAGNQEFLDTCEMCDVDPDTTNGFVFNTKRGTAYKFNEVGANFFLNGNMLTHIIRAHEVAPYGYEFHFVQKCVTIFSSSHYCGNDNECGFILADNQRLRVIVLDTANNASATD